MALLIIVSNFTNKSIEIQMYYGIYFIYLFVYEYINISVFSSSLWTNIIRKVMSKKTKKGSQVDWIIHYKDFDFYSNVKK